MILLVVCVVRLVVGCTASTLHTSLGRRARDKSVLLRGPTQDSLNRACAELKLFAPQELGGDQLGLSGLSKLADHHHKAGLRTAASWDVNYSDFHSYSNKNHARYLCHFIFLLKQAKNCDFWKCYFKFY